MVDIEFPDVTSLVGDWCCRVDYISYPGLVDVEYYNVTVSAGDCLYVPYGWWVWHGNVLL